MKDIIIITIENIIFCLYGKLLLMNGICTTAGSYNLFSY